MLRAFRTTPKSFLRSSLSHKRSILSTNNSKLFQLKQQEQKHVLYYATVDPKQSTTEEKISLDDDRHPIQQLNDQNEIKVATYYKQHHHGMRNMIVKTLMFTVGCTLFVLLVDQLYHKDESSLLDTMILNPIKSSNSLSSSLLERSTIGSSNEEQLRLLGEMWDRFKCDVKRYPELYWIIGANVAVFLLVRARWRDPRFYPFFAKHMSVSVMGTVMMAQQGMKRYHTLLTSSFTHVGGLHLAFNMYALYNMAPLLIAHLGTATFLSFYFSAALVSGMGALTVDLLRNRVIRGSIGASGCIFAVLAAGLALMSDDARVSLIFLPSSYSFDPKIFLPIYLCGEILFNILQKKVSLGTAAHVSGALFGYLIMSLLRTREHHRKPRKVSVNLRHHFYQGDVVQFRANGQGRMVSNVLKYEGGFKNDKFNGYGVLETPALRYIGMFEKGHFHGPGKLQVLSGGKVVKTIVGEFAEGKGQQ